MFLNRSLGWFLDSFLGRLLDWFFDRFFDRLLYSFLDSFLGGVCALPQVANHPYLIDGTEPHDGRGADALAALRIAASGKLQLLDTLLTQLKERGHRVLVFSQMRKARAGPSRCAVKNQAESGLKTGYKPA